MKKMLVCTILSSCIFSFGGLIHNEAYAAAGAFANQTDALPAGIRTPVKPPGDQTRPESGMADRMNRQLEDGKLSQGNEDRTGVSQDKSAPQNASGRPNMNGSGNANIVKLAAAVLGLDESTVTDSLQAGKTLLQIAADQGVDADEFLQKLTDAESASIDAEVSAGKIAQDQADRQKSGLSDRLKRLLEGAAGSASLPSGPDRTDRPAPSALGGDKQQDHRFGGGDTVTARVYGQDGEGLIDIKGHWAAAYLKNLAAKGVLQGDQDKRIHPDTTVTREEIAAMITRSFKLTSEPQDADDYSDVPKSRWSYDSIKATKEFFDTKSDEKGERSFNPGEGMKREDVAVVLVKALLRQNPELSLMDEASAGQLLSGTFADASSIPESMRVYVATAVNNGWIQGDDQGNFSPEKTVTRAEAAALLDRLPSGGSGS
ncbi:S-layer homology domain-containing protein [Paenibacillus hamazuiensis]|uniref:S-layer homology domain-containing protein n=1 Tax=Paenibacillus hamazuiensis TaxID=2936508 RepID=UPI00200C096F|nr:S-layer homology domain-containing protein [Paenibacillus hamazuiensis]